MKHNNVNIPTPETQKGVAIVIGLIMLLVMTLLGVQSMRSNSINEKMARNTIDRQRALEAAETALIFGENEVTDNAAKFVDDIFADGGVASTLNTTNFTTNNDGDECNAPFSSATKGLCTPAKQRLDYENTLPYENWMDITNDPKSINVWGNNGNHRKLNQTEATRLGVNTPPKYIIEFMGFIPDEKGTKCVIAASSTTTATKWPFCTQDLKLFRITALATAGADDNVRVMLQSTFVVKQ